MVLGVGRIPGVSSTFPEKSMSRTQSLSRRQVWRTRLRRYRQSDLTVAEFCRREGVSVPSFYQWKKKLADDNSPPLAAAEVVDPKFVPLVVNDSATHPAVTLRLPGGACIDVAPGFDRGQWTNLLLAVVDATNSDTRREAD